MRAARKGTGQRDEKGNEITKIVTDNEQIHQAFFSYWSPIVNKEHDTQAATQADGGVMQRITDAMQNRLTNAERNAITMSAILTEQNIRDAIKRVKANTAPGRDGLPIEPYTIDIDDPMIPRHLAELYQQIQKEGIMTENMRESTTTMAYKEKGEASNVANYRPIAVTATEYRILATAMAQRLAEVIHRLIGESQIGFQILRETGENIDLMEEVIRYANGEATARGGAIAILDNAHAFDYIARPFLWEALSAFGIPQCFIKMLQIMNTDTSTRLKINGTLGPAMSQTSGLRQGCPLSSLLFLIAMEVLLFMIREDTRITGIEIPNEEGNDTDGQRGEVCERSPADDLAVYMSNLET